MYQDQAIAKEGDARTKVSPIEEAQDRVAHRIDCAHELLNRLEARLEPVLRPMPPPDKLSGGEVAEAPASPLHGRMLNTNRSATSLCAGIELLLSRIVV